MPPTLCNRAPSGQQRHRAEAAGQRAHVVSSSLTVAATVALTSAVSCYPSLLRRARLSLRASTLVDTTYALRRRPTAQSVATLSRASTPAQDNNRHRGLCVLIVFCLFLGAVRHIHLSLILGHCCCEQSRPDLNPYAIAHSSPARAAHHPTLVNQDAHS